MRPKIKGKAKWKRSKHPKSTPSQTDNLFEVASIIKT
jgi:hypothetical protein